jgi:hypothetical protein
MRRGLGPEKLPPLEPVSAGCARLRRKCGRCIDTQFGRRDQRGGRKDLSRTCRNAAVDMVDLARASEGYTCAEIAHLCDEAARIALETNREITEIDLQRVMKNSRPAGYSNDPRGWQ